MDAHAPAEYQKRLSSYVEKLGRLDHLHANIGNTQIGLLSLVIVMALLALV